ncbi:hypothetical protein GGTG_13686 [Gaeumannomyces tritici R3-111a-1]|uniref:Uncharacterized protein n=1 Tax=Gaeumannomyces tritici (strain R3-111a-1) TaxID=644352 RepID=J3PJK0_GAET3|nr:hypothetical protein GGTG_13686 [Gaeumannomyces tritici R3-111a-1]EJT68745.1 hypothetical protein GGTG_13686 [Gaeumannomyces tritici R3-111a-1]
MQTSPSSYPVIPFPTSPCPRTTRLGKVAVMDGRGEAQPARPGRSSRQKTTRTKKMLKCFYARSTTCSVGLAAASSLSGHPVTRKQGVSDALQRSPFWEIVAAPLAAPPNEELEEEEEPSCVVGCPALCLPRPPRLCVPSR